MSYSNEIWKDIDGYEGMYQVSNLGRVKSLERVVKGSSKNGGKYSVKKKILNPILDEYYSIFLYKDSKSKKCKIHKLVAENFIQNP